MASTSTLPSNASSQVTPQVGDSLLHGMAIALILTVFQRCSGMVRGVLFCWALDDAELGLWSLNQSWLFALAPVAVMGITGVLRRYVEFYRMRGQLSRFLGWTLGPAAGLTLVATVLVWLGSSLFSSLLFRSAEHWQLVRLIAISLGAVVVFNTVQDLAESLKLLRVASWMRLVHSFAFTLLGVAGLLVFGSTAYVIAVAFLLATLLATVPGILVLKTWWSERHQQSSRTDVPAMWSKIGRFAAWLWILNIVANLFEISDRYMVMLFAGGSATENQALVGQLHSSRVFPLLLLGLATLVSNSLLPYLVTHWERGEKSIVRDYLNFSLKLASLGCTILGALAIVIAPVLFKHVFGGRYDDGLSVLPLTFVYCSWLSLFYISEDYLWCCEKGRWPTLTLAVGLVANLALNALLIPIWGLHGAAFATMLGNWIALASLFAISGRFGWTPGKTVLAFCLLPASLCFGGWAGLFVAAVVIGLAVRGWGWTPEEMELLGQLKGKVAHKLGRV